MSETQAWPTALSDADKQTVLARMSFDLTIAGRDVGVTLQHDALVSAFKGLNELQHKLSGEMVAIATGGGNYPWDKLGRILDEIAVTYGLSSYLLHAWDFARLHQTRADRP